MVTWIRQNAFNFFRACVMALVLVSGARFAFATEMAAATGKTSATVSFTIPNLVRVSGLDDMDLGIFAGSDLKASDPLCVYRNVSGAYAVTAVGGNDPAAFVLGHVEGGAAVPYQVSFGGVVLQAGQASSTFGGASTASTNCHGGSNAEVAVQVSANDILAAARPGLYADVLTVVVESR